MTNLFLYGRYSYEEPSMSSLSIIVCIIAIVFAVLEIILFFKIWGMTNDVKALRHELAPLRGKIYVDGTNFRKLLLEGNKEKLGEYLLDVFRNRIVFDAKEYAIQVSDEIVKMNLEFDIKYITKFYDHAKIPVPEVILNTTTEDVRTLINVGKL